MNLYIVKVSLGIIQICLSLWLIVECYKLREVNRDFKKCRDRRSDNKDSNDTRL